ncbi:MAG: DnaB-like helicase C-terminal domain-containing protein [Candidatus Thorarchaeota archaeon]
MIAFDNQYEQLALGLMINNEEAAHKGISQLISDYFFDPNLRYIFNALENLIKIRKEINIYNINEEIKSMGQVFSLEDLISMEDKFYFPEKFDSIIKSLKDKFKKRSALRKMQEIQLELQTSTKEYEEIIKDVGDLYHFRESSINRTISKENYLEVKQRHDEHKRTRIPIYTGYLSIDELLTYKLSTGEISVIAARPSNGKSALKANIIRNIGKNQPQNGVVSYALEQTEEVETDRMESIESGISIQEIAMCHKWAKSDPRWEKLIEARKRIATWNYYLEPGFNKSLAEMKNELRFYKSEGVKLVIWDLFDRMSEISGATANKAQTISNVLNRILGLCNELGMHFCLLVQLSRKAVDKSRTRREHPEELPMPTLSDLKDSGGYEEVARTVLLLHYPKHYKPDLVDSILQVKIAKQSNGPVKTIKLLMNPNSLKIEDNTSTSRTVKEIKNVDE